MKAVFPPKEIVMMNSSSVNGMTFFIQVIFRCRSVGYEWE